MSLRSIALSNAPVLLIAIFQQRVHACRSPVLVPARAIRHSNMLATALAVLVSAGWIHQAHSTCQFNPVGGTVVIPDTVTLIGNFAFSSCTTMTTLVIPDSVTRIGDSSFAYVKKENFFVTVGLFFFAVRPISSWRQCLSLHKYFF